MTTKSKKSKTAKSTAPILNTPIISEHVAQLGAIIRGCTFQELINVGASLRLSSQSCPQLINSDSLEEQFAYLLNWWAQENA